MNPRIISGLRTGEPGAIAELFDAVGEELFQYCWLMVRGHEAVFAMVRDTIIVAHAHIDQLRDPGQLRPWLYALARSECQRYPSAASVASAAPVAPAALEEAGPAINAARDAAGDEAQLMAWSAVMSLPSAEREMLDLTARHGMSASDAGLVTGLGAGAGSLIEQARASLQQAMSAEIAVRRPGARVGKVSPAKVYARLPWPTLPPGTRADILACFTGERQAGHQTLAASRVPPLDSTGFPLSAERDLASPPEPASPVSEAPVLDAPVLDAPVARTAPDGFPVARTAPDGFPVARTAPDGLPVASTAPDGLPVASTVPDGLPVAEVAAAGIDADHRSAASLPELFSRAGPVLASPVRVTASRQIAVGLLAAAIAVGAALVLAMAGLSLPGSTWSAPPVGSAVVAAGAPDGAVAHAGSRQGNTTPPAVVPAAGPTGGAQAAPVFGPTLGLRPRTGNAAALYLAIVRPQRSQGPTTVGGGVGQPPGSQPDPVSSTTSALPPPPVSSSTPSGSGSPNPSESASPSPSASTPSTSSPPSVSQSASPSSPPPSGPSGPSGSSGSSGASGSPAPSWTSAGSGSPAG